MPILTATEVTEYSNISASAATIAGGKWISVVQKRLGIMLNNYFLSELWFQTTATFNATARSITLDGVTFDEFNFIAGDDIFLYNSYRNDGYKTILSVSGTSVILVTSDSVVNELSGRTIMFNVVNWPEDVKEVAAQMIAFDYDVRPNITPGLKSFTLGPHSETYSNEEAEFGYPVSLINKLSPYKLARLS